MGPFSVMIARFPGGNVEHPESSGYVMGLQETLINDDRISKIHPWKMSDTPITMVRNTCVKDALAAGVDYILMIDSDMHPDCEPGAPPFWDTAWDFMMERRKKEEEVSHNYHPLPNFHKYGDPVEAVCRMIPPITIAAPYCGPPPNELCYVFKWASSETDTPEPRMKLSMIDREDAARRTGIEEVPALPTGLILYDARVFKRLPPPWFDYEWGDPPYNTIKATTEDVFQTRNAGLMGLPQYVAWDCWAGHIKSKTVTKPRPMTLASVNHEFANAVVRTAQRRNAGG